MVYITQPGDGKRGEMTMPGKRSKRGFTMAEMLIVTAIIAVLGGVILVSVMRYQRKMAHLERDSAAKEIFIAAQNHLTLAESQGYLGIGEDGFGIRDQSVPDSDQVYYFVVSDGSGFTSDQSTVLDLMLPFGSVDETVRTGGSYVIRYQASPAIVLDVFYCSADETRYGHSLAAGEYSSLLGLRDSDGNSLKEQRRNYGESVLGWYGGVGVVKSGTNLKAPVIEVTNAELLTVKVTDSNRDVSDACLKLIVTGCTSGAQAAFPLTQVTMEKRISSDNVKGTFTIVLDDITTEGMHFADLNNGDAPVLNGPFIPGENITVKAVAYSESELSNIAYSSEKTTNSIFADLKEDDETAGEEGSGEPTAMVANFRHLENLDDHISGVNTVSGSSGDIIASDTEDAGLKIAKAQQVTDLISPQVAAGTFPADEDAEDLSWDGFLASVRKAKDSEAEITVYDINGNGPGIKDGFVPMSPPYTITYDGQSHSISGVRVRDGSAAGLFGKPEETIHVSDLSLIHFDITAEGNAPAGALTGDLSAGSSITNVLAYRSAAAQGQSDTAGIRAETGNAGGLIGQISGKAGAMTTVINSGAAVSVSSSEGHAGGLAGKAELADISGGYAGGYLTQVYSSEKEEESGESTSSEGSSPDEKTVDPDISVSGGKNAGGLIGDASGINIRLSSAAIYTESRGGDAGGLIGSAENAQVEGCYSAGHTKEGAYTDNFTAGSEDAVRINVIGSESAGGLIGKASGITSIKYSYSTCSAGIPDAAGGSAEEKETAAGGLTGMADGSDVTVSYVYATGAVYGNEKTKTGTLVGAGSLKDRDEKKIKGAHAADLDDKQLIPGEETREKAAPYDEVLTEIFDGKYIFLTIQQLCSLGADSTDLEDAPLFAAVHFGDFAELLSGAETSLIIRNEETLRAIITMPAAEPEEETFISVLIHGDTSRKEVYLVLSVTGERTETGGDSDTDTVYRISLGEDSEIEGFETREKQAEWLASTGASVRNSEAGTASADLILTLDDITKEMSHFANLFTAFIPGENITIVADGGQKDKEALQEILANEPEGWRTETEEGKPSRVLAERTNSLYADPEKTGASEEIPEGMVTGSNVNEGVAGIGNFRHLENLSTSIGKPDENDTDGSLNIRTAAQLNDLDWEDFLIKMRELKAEDEEYPVSDITVCTAAGAEAEKNCLMPVNPEYELNYLGQGYSIANVVVKVNNNEDAGLFGSLRQRSSVADLELKDFDISAASGNAGTLAGSADRAEITNVLSHGKEASVTAETGSAGGLAGRITGSIVTKSAAAVLVSSTSGNAGGLFGSTSGGSVKASYSGGHTVEGAYSGTDFNVRTTSGKAGGLAGEAETTSFISCYSTCSAQGAVAGGLVGSGEGHYSDCYATGLVSGTASEGAFAGTFTGTASGCSYFEIINERLEDGSFTYLGPVSGRDEMTGITAFDETADTYNAFCGTPDDWREASVYDDTLTAYYKGKYNLKTAEQLLGADADVTVGMTDLVHVHYGDWPAPEIFVVNTAE